MPGSTRKRRCCDGFAETFAAILGSKTDAEQPKKGTRINQQADEEERSVSKAGGQSKLQRAAGEPGRQSAGGGEERGNPCGLQLRLMMLEMLDGWANELKPDDNQDKNEAENLARAAAGEPFFDPDEEHAGEKQIHRGKRDENEERPSNCGRLRDSEADQSAEQPHH